MSKYTGRKVRLGTSLDELGIMLGLKRLEGESITDYRRRLALQAKTRPDQSEKSFIDTISRSVGLFEEDLLEIDLVLDSDGEPVAPAPRIEVTSAFIRVWSDENAEPDLELDIFNHGYGYHIGEVEEALRALSFITVESLPREPDTEAESYKYKRSWFIKCSDSDGMIYNTPLKRMRMNKFYKEDMQGFKYLYNCLFTSPLIFANEVTDYDLVQAEGDYYVDFTNGVVFSYLPAAGLMSCQYRDFPYTIAIQPVKVIPPYDPDIDTLKKNYLISDDTGLEERLSLNSYGAQVTNQIINAYPLQWGKDE